MRIGMDYYPEWETEDMWEADASRMKEAGVAMVRIGEFAWSGMQPRYEGIRGHRCVNSPSFRKRTERIVTELAVRYGSNPSVIGWQTDNEFEMTLCNCASCDAGFREWVRRKYGTLETVNREWGLAVWSGEYSSWVELDRAYESILYGKTAEERIQLQPFGVEILEYK
ncbi:beta-galactosidase [Paenibacillus sp. N4]|uniref:beta-galactosidase n=1 Tax=Paenibacillus vietnamensis TaxID=2590547 RepID=UPI001CD0F3EB|nr:beta-galactosidase [Paenibacillus vietnamensis]MCA0758080.1 beta-galactosidase [Paenibacillus vietnamensis]